MIWRCQDGKRGPKPGEVETLGRMWSGWERCAVLSSSWPKALVDSLPSHQLEKGFFAPAFLKAPRCPEGCGGKSHPAHPPLCAGLSLGLRAALWAPTPGTPDSDTHQSQSCESALQSGQCSRFPCSTLGVGGGGAQAFLAKVKEQSQEDRSRGGSPKLYRRNHSHCLPPAGRGSQSQSKDQ